MQISGEEKPQKQMRESFVLCKHCGKQINVNTYLLHEARCGITRSRPIYPQDIEKIEKQEMSHPYMGQNSETISKQQVKKEEKRPLIEIKNSSENTQKISCDFCGHPLTLQELDSYPLQCKHHDQECSYCHNKFPKILMDQHHQMCNELKSSQKNQRNRMWVSQIDDYENPYSPLTNFYTILQRMLDKKGNNQNQGLTKEQFKQLKRYKYKENNSSKKQGEKDICTICYCQFHKDQNIYQLKCKHNYHEECITKWMERTTKCPLCKTSQSNRPIYEQSLEQIDFS